MQLIADRVKARAPGKWSGYVEQDLLPRLHGFELLMASYAMCHMKLDMQLTESGYKPSAHPPRLSVWLTNALEPAERDVRELFFQPLAEEARGASEVKRQTPIMCVIGNPPYSISSSNKGKWIEALNRDYKVELNETNVSPLSDDYIKFIRIAHDVVVRNGTGVLAYISNNSFMHGLIHRTMRRKLLQDFDKLFIVNLHGNSNIKEVAPGGGEDENVFDIRQGVAAYIFVRCPGARDRGLAEVRYMDAWGSRAAKNDVLFTTSIASPTLAPIVPTADSYVLVPRATEGAGRYAGAISVKALFPLGGIGVKFRKDNLLVKEHFDLASAQKMVADVQTLSAAALTAKYHFSETDDWKVDPQRANFLKPKYSDFVAVNYRPFDDRITFYPLDRISGIIPRGDSRKAIMEHFVNGANLGLSINRQIKGPRPFTDALVCQSVFDLHGLSMKEANHVVPLYTYPLRDARQGDALAQSQRALNLDPKLYTAICTAAGVDPADQTGPDDDFRAATGDTRPSEVKVFDYIYGVLHAPNYRATFAEFLKIDFPRIPYPASPDIFRHVSDKGEQLRRLHLVEPAAIGDTPYPFVGEGDDIVAAGYPKFEDGRVRVNPDQAFDAVPAIAWSFHIGGYQPAQKWLKDRRGRTLSWDDIGHYQKIVKILAETDRVMREIELPLGEVEGTRD